MNASNRLNICIIAPRDGQVVTGVNTFNAFMAKTLKEMGNSVELAVPEQPFTFSMLERMAGDTGCSAFEISGTTGKPGLPAFLENHEAQKLSKQLQPFGTIIVSGAHFNYARIIRAALGRRVIVWTHGQQISPLAGWDGEELKRENVTYVCINAMHMQEATFKGVGDRAVQVGMPVLLPSAEVKPAGGRCVAVGNLEPRKQYGCVAEMAKAMGHETRVYGAELDKPTRAIIDKSAFLQYRGYVP